MKALGRGSVWLSWGKSISYQHKKRLDKGSSEGRRKTVCDQDMAGKQYNKDSDRGEREGNGETPGK